MKPWMMSPTVRLQDHTQTLLCWEGSSAEHTKPTTNYFGGVPVPVFPKLRWP
jgi:hypothetical protein